MAGELVLWINKGVTFRALGRIIKPNEKFRAYADQIPQEYKLQVEPVDAPPPLPPRPIKKVATERLPLSVSTPRPATNPSTVRPTVTPGYRKRERSPGVFDILDTNGKALNERPLTEADAEELLKSLG